MESFRNVFRRTEQAEQKEEKPFFNVGDAFLEAYGRMHEKDPRYEGIMKEVVQQFFEQELQNTRMHVSPESGAEFPFTSIRVGELARTLYARYRGEDTAVATKMEPALSRRQRKEFIMSSFYHPIGGHQFGYAELTLHRALGALNVALKDLERGREPDDYEIFTLGSPTNESGYISEAFAGELKSDAFGAMGKLYAEVVAAEIEKVSFEQRAETSITLTGVSMGASMAAEAASELLEKHVVTQDKGGDAAVPNMAVAMYVPAGLNDSKLGPYQIKYGYAAEAVQKMLTSPETRHIMVHERKFLDGLFKALPDTLTQRMDPEQKKAKWDGIHSIIGTLTKGVPLPEDVKVNEIIGVYDPLMFSFERKRQSQEQQEEHEGSFAQYLLPAEGDENTRVFGVGMTHRIPFYRENEFKRWDAVAKELLYSKE